MRAERAATGVIAQVEREGAIAVVRLSDASGTVRAVDALVAGGVRIVELTLTTPGALEAIAELASRDRPDVLVGAGSVLDVATAAAAVAAGATFIVSPVLLPDVVAETHRLGAAAMPGAYTPTEILAASRAGGDAVKVFPADTLGAAFIKGVLAPMPFLRIVPTGGVTPDNAGEWIAAGAVAVGVGSALVSPVHVARGDFDELTARAKRLVASVGAARRASG